MNRDRGFTLIEILVVMVIVGAMVGMITLVATGSRDKQELENEARRLMAVLQLASEEAVMQNLDIGLEISEEGYQFRGFDEENLKWITLPQGFLKAETFPDNLQVDLADLPAGMSLKQREEEAPGKVAFIPQVLLLSSGDSTPFSLRLSLENLPGVEYRVSTDGYNAFELEIPEDE